MKRALTVLFIVAMASSLWAWGIAVVSGGSSSTSVSSIKVLVVGAGGGSGYYYGGGGGQVNYNSSVSVSAQTYTITVGNGGTAGSTSSAGGTGVTSSFGSVVSANGGQGGQIAAGGNNGAGTHTGGSGEINAKGGGAGDAANGSNGSGSTGGNGGTGTANSITGASTYYGGGGGGAGSISDGSGGSGGGGSSAAGTANTGGGGGAAWSTSGYVGGSGVVIVAVPLTSNQTYVSGTTGNPTIAISGSDLIYTFKTSGSITFGSSLSGYYVNLQGDASQQFFYNFENALTDGSGNSNTLVRNNGTTSYSSSTGVVIGAACLQLDGSTDFGVTDANLSADIPGKYGVSTTAFTICFRIRAHDVSTTQDVIIITDGTYFPWAIYINSTHLNFWVQETDDSYNTVTNYATMSADTVYTFICEWDGSNNRIYSNVASSTVLAEDDNSTPTACTSMRTNTSGNSTLWVGGWGAGFYVAGTSYIDDVACFDRTLTANEKQSYFNHGTNCSKP